MGGGGVSGGFGRDDRAVRAESGASCSAGGAASFRRAGDFVFVLGRGAIIRKSFRWGRLTEGRRFDSQRGQKWRRIGHPTMVALLAALVSASFLFVLLRGAGAPGAHRESGMGGREAHCVRPLADGRASLGVAGTVCDAAAERFFPTGVPDVLRLPAGAGRNSLSPEGLAGILVGDDVFGGGLRDRVRDRDAVSD